MRERLRRAFTFGWPQYVILLSQAAVLLAFNDLTPPRIALAGVLVAMAAVGAVVSRSGAPQGASPPEDAENREDREAP
ncbi:hypothetical protein BN1051_02798 [Arthrobacter saudimassiliensis]|uniref:Uncharacterized protein n=1 Tax=Arthrobacter saudimassiliensis TaxID=1461584 RepID=A0A078MQC7_9MICC|nr:hypothetical protein BN1051_02798 [Arthrobacter saudimassiliensis]